MSLKLTLIRTTGVIVQALFGKRRKRFNSEVRDLLAGHLGLSENSLGTFKFLEVLDITWATGSTPHQAALIICYAHLAALLDEKGDATKVKAALRRTQERWIAEKLVSESLVARYAASLEQRNGEQALTP